MEICKETSLIELISIARNDISICIKLNMQNPVEFGAKLYYRMISGSRVVVSGVSKTICGVKFNDFGAHICNYPFDYLTVAVAVGVQKEEIDRFLCKFKTLLSEIG